MATITAGTATKRKPGNRYQLIVTSVVRAKVWKVPIQCPIIQESGSHINPLRMPTVRIPLAAFGGSKDVSPSNADRTTVP